MADDDKPTTKAAKPKPRPYTGFDQVWYPTPGGPPRRLGTSELVRQIKKASQNRLANLGTYGIRTMRDKPTKMSVHATGRAADIGRSPYNGSKGASRSYMVEVIDWLVANAEQLGIEMIADYEWQGATPTGGPAMGRVWKCNRLTWKGQEPGSIAGGGYGKWIHIELAPEVADRPEVIAAVFAQGTFPEPVKPKA